MPGNKSPSSKKETLRGNDISVKNDSEQDVSISLEDHDNAVIWYFENALKLFVVNQGNKVNIPIIYGTQERWKAVQKDGFYRDRDGKVQCPLIMFKRTGFSKNRELGYKLDGNKPAQFQIFEKKYSNRNVYDNFTALIDRTPVRELHAVIIPDYITLNYEFIVWTDYIEQMNKVMESINYSSDGYWGDPTRFKFKAKIDDYSNTNELTKGEDRTIKTTFNMTLNGYLIPDSLNKKSTAPEKSYSKAVIRFKTEIIK